MKRLIFVLAVAVLAVVGVRALFFARGVPELPVIGTVPKFELVAQNGQPFSSADLAQHTWIGAFIYTTCPGPCPRVVETLINVDRRLSQDPRLRLVSFSVDPSADTPDVLAVYARTRGMDPVRWTLLTGDVDIVYALIRDGFKLGVEQNDGDDVAKLGPIVHSTYAVLVDSGMRVRGYYDTTDPEAMVRLVRDAGHLAAASPR
jgi:protein SCO1/2